MKESILRNRIKNIKDLFIYQLFPFTGQIELGRGTMKACDPSRFHFFTSIKGLLDYGICFFVEYFIS
jgi:hypothetical protein